MAQASKGAGFLNCKSNCCSSARSEVKYSSMRARSLAPSLSMRPFRSSLTADNALRLTMMRGSGLKSSAFGSLNSGPKMRVYNAAGEISAGLLTAPPKLL
jgi:hypothetical protein